MSSWLMIGTSPSVVETLPTVGHHDRVITCNGGLSLEPSPDVYIATDQYACHNYAEQARAAQASGSHLVTLRRVRSALDARDCAWYDEFLDLSNGPPTRDHWGAFRYTGPLCLEYALRRGATSITLVGCDGYRGGNDGSDYFDSYVSPHTPSRSGLDRTREVLAPAFEARARLFPEVPITQLGDPCYTIDSPNWTVRQWQSQ